MFVGFSRLQQGGGLPRGGVVEDIDLQELTDRLVVILLVIICFADHQLRPSDQIASFTGVDYRLVGGARLVPAGELLQGPPSGVIHFRGQRVVRLGVGLEGSGGGDHVLPLLPREQALHKAALDRPREPRRVGRVARFGGKRGEERFGRGGVARFERDLGAKQP